MTTVRSLDGVPVPEYGEYPLNWRLLLILLQKMASFSGALKLVDLDDFITPSQVSSLHVYWLYVLILTLRTLRMTLTMTLIQSVIDHLYFGDIKCLCFTLQECIKPVKIEKTSDKVSIYCHLLLGTGILSLHSRSIYRCKAHPTSLEEA